MKFAAKISDYAVNPAQIESFLEKYTAALRDSLNVEKVSFLISESVFENRGSLNDSVIFLSDKEPLWGYIQIWRKAKKYPVFTTKTLGPVRDILQSHGAFLFMPFRKFRAGIIMSAKTSGKSFYSEDMQFLKRVLKLTEPLLENYQFLIANSRLKRQEKELELALRIQEKLIPSAFRDMNINFMSFFRGSRKVTGDYIDFMNVGHEKYFLFLGDVSGHGLGSAYIMAIARSIIRSSIYEFKIGLADVFNRLNDFLIHKYKGSNIITLVGIEISFEKDKEKKTTALKYINAGQHSPLLYTADDQQITKFKNVQRVLGAAKTNYQEHRLKVTNPAKIIIYSDGAFEIFNEENKMIGENQLVKWIKKSIHHSPEEQIEIMTKKIFSYGSAEPHDYDDISFVVTEIL